MHNIRAWYFLLTRIIFLNFKYFTSDNMDKGQKNHTLLRLKCAHSRYLTSWRPETASFHWKACSNHQSSRPSPQLLQLKRWWIQEAKIWRRKIKMTECNLDFWSWNGSMMLPVEISFLPHYLMQNSKMALKW